jgi:chromosome segregation ATPase
MHFCGRLFDYRSSPFILLSDLGGIQMRFQSVLLVLLVISIAPSSFAQSSGTEEQTLASILAELRSMHEDMRASQSLQVLIAEMQIQQDAVNRASDRAEQARSILTTIQSGLKEVTIRLSDAQDKLSSAANSADQTRWKDEVDREQQAIKMMQGEEQARSSTFDDLQTKLRNAQDDLDSTQNQLNALLKKIAPGPPPAH